MNDQDRLYNFKIMRQDLMIIARNPPLNGEVCAELIKELVEIYYNNPILTVEDALAEEFANSMGSRYREIWE